ncbi:helix-turn-helix domain-containing protein [Rhodoblastus sphagnicola]|uniref:helix-turn-helix domain-containing protein n=1 Tax=Rhodoblastus sphagnicola TaxID=333368 RepID=UPI0011B0F3F0
MRPFALQVRPRGAPDDIALREDLDARSMRVAAERAKDAAQARRLLALATTHEAAEIGGVARQIFRDWVLKFNADGPEGLINRKAPARLFSSSVMGLLVSSSVCPFAGIMLLSVVGA